MTEHPVYKSLLQQTAAENEQLRVENAKLQWQLKANSNANKEYADRNAVLAAENTKLRAALAKIDHDAQWDLYADIARAALKETK